MQPPDALKLFSQQIKNLFPRHLHVVIPAASGIWTRSTFKPSAAYRWHFDTGFMSQRPWKIIDKRIGIWVIRMGLDMQLPFFHFRQKSAPVSTVGAWPGAMSHIVLACFDW
jgi:hypothetical protein